LIIFGTSVTSGVVHTCSNQTRQHTLALLGAQNRDSAELRLWVYENRTFHPHSILRKLILFW
jgi:hypothetical protein